MENMKIRKKYHYIILIIGIILQSCTTQAPQPEPEKKIISKPEEHKPAEVSETPSEQKTADKIYNVGNTIRLKSPFPFKSKHYWRILKKPQGSMVSLSSHTATNPMFSPDKAGLYELELINESDFNQAKKIGFTVVENKQSTNLQGKVDSSFLNKLSSNAIYIYKGRVSPNDLGSRGPVPEHIAVVQQEKNSCNWNYRVEHIIPGVYTLALTLQTDQDNSEIDDQIEFVQTKTVEIKSGMVVADFKPNRIIRVGIGENIKLPSEAAKIAKSGDVIEILAGRYENDMAIWRQNDITIRGIGGRAQLIATRPIAYVSGDDQSNGKGIWVTRGNNISVENIEFSGARVSSKNGAGIRAEGKGLYVCNSRFIKNENGILGGGGNVIIEYSEFDHNGHGDGQSHNMYIERTDNFIFRFSKSHHAKIGHNIKTRAKRNFILYNHIMDTMSGTASYQIDIPNGGESYIIGNSFHQGPKNDNSTLISFGAEGLINQGHRFYVINNTMINDDNKGAFVVAAHDEKNISHATILNNVLVGPGEILRGKGFVQRNVRGTKSFFHAVPELYDYRLNDGVSAINAGIEPNVSVSGIWLMPLYQFSKDGKSTRINYKDIDVGAFEYHMN